MKTPIRHEITSSSSACQANCSGALKPFEVKVSFLEKESTSTEESVRELTDTFFLNRYNATSFAQTEIGIPISVWAKEVALYVTLTTFASGVFSDNAFFLGKNEERIVWFVGTDQIERSEDTRKILKETLRVEHLGWYFGSAREQAFQEIVV